MTGFMQQVINGLSIGSIYALIALGYTMTYGVIKLINFAHGELYMFGAYMAFVAMTFFGASLWVALLFAILTTAFLGFVIERVAYKPLRNASRISVLITAIAVSLLLQYSIMYIFRAEPKTFPQVDIFPAFQIGGVTILGHQILIFALTILTLVSLQFIVYKTSLGRAMRAVSIDAEAASLMGINVNRIISITFVIGSVLAAIAGVLIGVYYTRITPTMGATRGLKAFIAAVFGGIGILEGAVLGGFLIGMIETMAGVLHLSMWAEAIVYLILILVLLMKPSGLLGKKGGEKV